MHHLGHSDDETKPVHIDLVIHDVLTLAGRAGGAQEPAILGLPDVLEQIVHKDYHTPNGVNQHEKHERGKQGNHISCYDLSVPSFSFIHTGLPEITRNKSLQNTATNALMTHNLRSIRPRISGTPANTLKMLASPRRG
jgi:hypothetical protein